MKRKVAALTLLVTMLTFLTALPTYAQTVYLDRGVTYTTITRENSKGQPILINIVKANLNDSRVESKLVMGQDTLGKTETLSSMASRNHAIAGINGGFFSVAKRAIPTDTFILDGSIISKGTRDPAVFGIKDGNEAFIDVFTLPTVLTVAKNFRQFDIEAINHETGVGVILYTPAFGQETGTHKTAVEYQVRPVNGKYIIQAVYQGNAPIPPDGYVISFQGVTGNLAELEVGDEVSVNTYFPDAYQNVDDMLGCSPLLVRNGQTVNPDLTNLEPRLANSLPRSAIGLTSDNHLILVTVGGIQPGSAAGMTYPELANMMKNLGAKNAVGLDGGSSTTMYVDGTIVNNPSAKTERNIANAILVISQIPVYLNNERLYFDSSPVIRNDRVMVPMRGIFEAMGAQVDWDAATQTVTASKDGNVVKLTIGKAAATLNGNEIKLDAAPFIAKGRTLVPIRFVANALNADVRWDQATESVHIST